MTAQLLDSTTATNPVALAKALAAEFEQTAIERDIQGGTPQQERNLLRDSNLLSLVIPQANGGLGETWLTATAVIREFAKVDSSIAHVLSYHYLGVTIPYIFGSAAQTEQLYTETVRQRWFWCNALNPLDRRTTITPAGDTFRLKGTKSFCSGSKDSDVLPVTAVHQETGELLVLAIPTRREGVTIHSDWDNIGQRQTDSGSITFDDVTVHPKEIFDSRDHAREPFGTIRTCLAQLNLANIYLGIAEGAFLAAKRYTQTESRPWFSAGVERATEDPYILQHYGNLWVDLQGAISLTNQAAIVLQSAWEKGWSLTVQERGDTAVAIALAKVATTRTGLAIASQIFELMGARATHQRYGFDRYWRNLRTFTLHDPVDYKVRDLGNWALNDTYPTPDFYA